MFERVLLPRIKANFDISGFLFWHGMATYLKTTSDTAHLESKDLDFVKRDENATNLPQCHPIKKFWTPVKHEVSKYPK